MQNKINNEIVTARGVARCSGLVRCKRKDFGGVMSGNVYRSIVAGKNNRDYFDGAAVALKTKYLDDAYAEGDIDLNAQGIAKANQLMARDSAIYANMQNKINNETAINFNITINKNPAFMIVNHEILQLVSQIYHLNNKIIEKCNDLPGIARQYFTNYF